MSYRFVDGFRAAAAGSGWNCSSILILLDSCLLFQNKFEKLVNLVGFIARKIHDLF
jgi:hypothetical protein